jgi:hypothetical protein
MWTIGVADRLRFPGCRANSETRKMLAFPYSIMKVLVAAKPS